MRETLLVRWGPAGVGALMAAALALAGCVDRADLLGPEDEEEVSETAPRLFFTTEADSLTLREGDAVGIKLSSPEGRTLPAQLLLLDSARTVLWRSEARSAEGAEQVVLQVAGLPASLPRGKRLLVTALMEDAKGTRYYATHPDSAARTSISKAEVRPVVVYDGLAAYLEAGSVDAIVAAPEVGRVFVANGPASEVAEFHLGEHGWWPGLPAGGSPMALDYRDGRLAVLSGGADVSVLDLRDGSGSGDASQLIPSVFARVAVPAAAPDSTGKQEWDVRDVPVRPYAGSITLGCLAGQGGACGELTAFGASAISGEDGGSGRGVARELRVSPTRVPVSPVLVPAFERPIAKYLRANPQDTTWAKVEVIAGLPASQGAEVLFAQPEAADCVMMALGSGSVLASPIPGGPLFAASDDPSPLCGDGSRILRLDAPATTSARVSAQALGNLLGENRIGAISQMKISSDGTRLLLLGDGVVYVTDDLLRLRARVSVPGAASIAWLKEPDAVGSAFFAVGDALGVTVYETGRFTPLRRTEVGPTAPRMLELLRGEGRGFRIVGVLKDRSGLVVARLPGG